MNGTGGFTSTKAIVATVVTVLGALVSLLAAAGLHVRPELRDALVNFFTVVTPVAVLVYGWLHHSHVQRVAALYHAQASTGIAPVAPPPAGRHAPHTK